MAVEDFIDRLEKKGILVGVPLKWFFKDSAYASAVLINFTELHKKADIDSLISAIGELT
jgi:DNA-binding transcriptional MocR family regulator